MKLCHTSKDILTTTLFNSGRNYADGT